MFMDSDRDYCTKPGHFWLESSRFTSRGTCLVTSYWRIGFGKTDAYLNSYGLFVDAVKSTARGFLCSGALARTSRAPWVSTSTDLRIFCNHVTVHRLPAVRPYFRHANVYSRTFQLLWEPREPRRKLIAHQCCNQLTAVKTRYPLTSIT